jgi:hypothetical protein
MITNLNDFVLDYIKTNNITIGPKTDITKIRYDICKEFVKLGRIFNLEAFNHKLYPVVSSSRGRPQISWSECAHHNCSKCFNTRSDLREHLTKLNTYTPFYSQSHEIIPGEKKYNYSNGKFYCLSPLCEFKTSDEKLMHQHFKLLGIAPYFKVGDEITPEEYYKFYIDTNQVISPYTNFTKLAEVIDIILAHGLKYNNEDVCCCCLTAKPNIIFTSCSHKVLCGDCMGKMSNKRCPVCKKNSTTYLKIDTSLGFYHPNVTKKPLTSQTTEANKEPSV